MKEDWKALADETEGHLRKLMVQDQNSAEEGEDSADDDQHWRSAKDQQHDRLFD